MGRTITRIPAPPVQWISRRLKLKGVCARSVLVTVTLALGCVVAIVPSASGSGPTTGATYVALGDSYSSGEGLGNYQPGTAVNSGPKRNTCHRADPGAYSELSPQIVLPSITNRAFWACSGATVLDTESSASYGQPVQTSTVRRTTKYITLSVGGDDIGFGALGRSCAELSAGRLVVYRFSSTSCGAQIKDSLRKLTTLAGPKGTLATLYESLLSSAAPGARLVVLGYPQVFRASYSDLTVLAGGEYCYLDNGPAGVAVGMPLGDAEALGRLITDLNSTIALAVDYAALSYPGQIAFADTAATSVPRSCLGYTPNATVTGFEFARDDGTGTGWNKFVSSATFHPTASGQKMFAGQVEAAFKGLAGEVALPARAWTPISGTSLGSPDPSGKFSVSYSDTYWGGVFAPVPTSVGCNYRLSGMAVLEPGGSGYGFGVRASVDADGTPHSEGIQYDAGAGGYRNTLLPQDSEDGRVVPATVDNNWHAISVAVVGNRYQSSVDGQVIFTGETPLTCGGVFVRVWRSSIKLRNVSVMPIWAL